MAVLRIRHRLNSGPTRHKRACKVCRSRTKHASAVGGFVGGLIAFIPHYFYPFLGLNGLNAVCTMLDTGMMPGKSISTYKQG